MAKSLTAPYEAGRRGAGWLKVKPVHTLDLVVLAVEWGSGRRKGKLSNIHLGALDPAERRLRHAGQDVQGHDRRDAGVADRAVHGAGQRRHRGYVVQLRPEQVVEVAFDGVQGSSRYPGGLALRFARVLRYRDDKEPEPKPTPSTPCAPCTGVKLPAAQFRVGDTTGGAVAAPPQPTPDTQTPELHPHRRRPAAGRHHRPLPHHAPGTRSSSASSPLLGAVAWAIIAFVRGETVNAVWFVVAAVCTYVIGYRFYARLIETKIVRPRDDHATPAEVFDDGNDYVPTDRRVLFGHHFAAIAGAGPLVGPVLAAQMGYLPGTIWIIIGVVFAGCVQDYLVLWISMRRRGRSLGQMARDELGVVGGAAALVGGLRHHGDHHRGARAGGGQRPGRKPVGRVLHRDDHPDRPVHGLLPAVPAPGRVVGGVRDRRRAAAARRHPAAGSPKPPGAQRGSPCRR